ncbi:DUF4190 domain-containing protein [Kocuria sp. ZOR0020]|uniref:DUF4190 domain-containing protein n=1 Tax=Kocuria sp. ZOR0020 TaxID=1339234 RepID=UPI000646F057|nr:DUF4190 domain-containing protein [Kocuria sp. ZOR0020]
MSYERPQNTNDPNAPWSSDQGGQGADPNVGGQQPVRDGGPKGNVYDPTSEPPRYGVRVPEGQGNGQPAQDGQQQPWNSGQNNSGQNNYGPGQQGQNQYGQNNYGQNQQAAQPYNPNPYGQGSYNQNGGQDFYTAQGGSNQNPYDQPYAAPPVTPGRGLAVAAVVLGTLSIVLFFLGLTVLLAVLGLIFAIVALVKARKVPGARRGMGITGLVLNIIGLILSGIALVFWILVGGVAWQMFQDPAVQQCVSQYMDDQNQAAYEQCLEDNLQVPGQNS